MSLRGGVRYPETLPDTQRIPFVSRSSLQSLRPCAEAQCLPSGVYEPIKKDKHTSKVRKLIWQIVVFKKTAVPGRLAQEPTGASISWRFFTYVTVTVDTAKWIQSMITTD